MALTINTGLGSLIDQKKCLNKQILRMTFGSKNITNKEVNSNIRSNPYSTKIQSNASVNLSLRLTAESNYELILQYKQRIKELIEEAAKGNYSTELVETIVAEVAAAGLTEKSANDYSNVVKSTGDINDVLLTLDNDLTTAKSLTEVDLKQSRLITDSIQFDNVTSALSSVEDADKVSKSLDDMKSEILQQASATLLATANQTPSVALELI